MPLSWLDRAAGHRCGRRVNGAWPIWSIMHADRWGAPGLQAWHFHKPRRAGVTDRGFGFLPKTVSEQLING